MGFQLVRLHIRAILSVDSNSLGAKRAANPVPVQTQTRYQMDAVDRGEVEGRMNGWMGGCFYPSTDLVHLFLGFLNLRMKCVFEVSWPCYVGQ